MRTRALNSERDKKHEASHMVKSCPIIVLLLNPNNTG